MFNCNEAFDNGVGELHAVVFGIHESTIDAVYVGNFHDMIPRHFVETIANKRFNGPRCCIESFFIQLI